MGLLPGEGVLHPVLVVTVGVVLAGVGATRLLAVGGGGGGLDTVESIVSLCFFSASIPQKIRTRK